MVRIDQSNVIGRAHIEYPLNTIIFTVYVTPSESKPETVYMKAHDQASYMLMHILLRNSTAGYLHVYIRLESFA